MTRNEESDRLIEGVSINSTREISSKPYRVTVECPLILVAMAITLTGATVSNIILYRTCIHSLNHTHEECKSFLSPIKSNATKHLEEDVQKYAAFVTTVKVVLESVGPCILSLFLGAWSNTYGRRPLIIWPIFGMTLTSILTVIFSLGHSFGPWWYILTIIPTSFTGSFIVLFIASYCYVSDVASSDKTSLRMIVVDATFSAGRVTGSLIAKHLILSIGNDYTLLFGGALNVMAFSFAIVFIPESVTGALEGGFSKLFDMTLVKEMAHKCFKSRPNHGRIQILLLTTVNIISVFGFYGTSILEYLYTREKLHWALVDFNTYSAVTTTVGFFSGFLGLYVGQTLLKISDIMLAVFSVATVAAQYFIKSIAVYSWQMYLGSVISLGLASSLIKSYLSKNLPADDISQVFAMMGVCEAPMLIISPIAFTALYTQTISTFPGAFLLFSCGLTVICLVLLLLVKYYSSENTHGYEPLEDRDFDQVYPF